MNGVCVCVCREPVNLNRFGVEHELGEIWWDGGFRSGRFFRIGIGKLALYSQNEDLIVN